MYTVLKLITNAFYLSGIVAREFQEVTGGQAQDGLDILNDILDDTAVENDMIPYYSQYKQVLQPGQYTYFIPNLILVDTLVFFISGIRYSMTQFQRKQFFGVARADNIQSLPFSWHIERQANGATLFLYFLPDSNYPIELWGQFKLNQVTINQDLQASQAVVDVGNVLYTPPGTIPPGQFVINGFDCAGTYANAIALFNFINLNSSAIGANASLSNNDLILRSPNTIVLTSAGNGISNITFSNFSTINGYANQNYNAVQMERWYVNYLKYYLAKRMCIEWNYDVPMMIEKQLVELQMMISKRSQQLDLTMQKISTLQKDTTLNFGFINLSHGWVT
jgi:hypothetical protein